MTHPIRRSFLLLITLVLTLSASTLTIAACERNPVKAVEGGVHVDTANCNEAPLVAGQDPNRAFLDCISGGDVRIRIELQRTAWKSIQGHDTAPPLASAGAPTLSIDGARCREDALDKAASEQALLSCEGLIDAGKVSFLVSIGRQEWRAIKARTIPAPYEAGPGK
jgi:hypothetical protein